MLWRLSVRRERGVGLKVGRSDERLWRGHRGADGWWRGFSRVKVSCCCRVGNAARSLEHLRRSEFYCLVVMMFVSGVMLVGGHRCDWHVVVHHVDVWPLAVIGVRIRISIAVSVVLVLLILVAISRVAKYSIVSSSMVLSVGVRGRGRGAMNSLVQVRILVGCAEALCQLVFVNPAVGPSSCGRWFGDPVWSTSGLHHDESSVSF